jgi:hypothetical protein
VFVDISKMFVLLLLFLMNCVFVFIEISKMFSAIFVVYVDLCVLTEISKMFNVIVVVVKMRLHILYCCFC